MTGALPNAIGVTVLSPRGRIIDIGDTGCVLLGDPIIASTFNTDANGEGRDRLAFPPRFKGRLYAQAVTIRVSERGVAVATSNTLEIGCR